MGGVIYVPRETTHDRFTKPLCCLKSSFKGLVIFIFKKIIALKTRPPSMWVNCLEWVNGNMLLLYLVTKLFCRMEPLNQRLTFALEHVSTMMFEKENYSTTCYYTERTVQYDTCIMKMLTSIITCC